MTELSGKTALVVGGSRGFGRGIADALLAAGAAVHVVARNPEPLAELERAGRGRIGTTAADAADPEVSLRLLDEVKPNIVILNAGASPQLEPIYRQTWESFSINWNSDVRIAFHWLRQILLTPLPPGSQVVAMSSGAALRGSPISGGYAGAKATIRFIAQYAAEESRRAKLGIRVHRDASAAHPDHRTRPGGGRRLRTSLRAYRGAVPGANGSTAHAAAGRRGGDPAAHGSIARRDRGVQSGRQRVDAPVVR